MAKQEQTAVQAAGEQPLVLKDPAWAAFLAWLLPGLGHWYQGRKPKAALFFICIMGLFIYGLYLGGSRDLGWGRVVYYGGRERLPFICQIGIGAPAFPALLQAMVVSGGKKPWCKGFMAPPAAAAGDDRNPDLHRLNKELHDYWELGTVFTMVAGLLNVLAIFDAAYGPVVGEDGKKDDEEDEDDQADAKKEPPPEQQKDGGPA